MMVRITNFAYFLAVAYLYLYQHKFMTAMSEIISTNILY